MRLSKDKDIYKRIILLAIPMMLQNLITYSVGLADNLMIGSLGDSAISGVYMGNQVQTVLQVLNAGIEGGILLISAQYWGKKDTKSIQKITSIGLWFSLILGLVFSVITTFMPRQVISIFTNVDAVIDNGVSYLSFLCFSYVFFSLTQALLASMRSVESPRIGLIVSLSSLFIDVILNYLLIFGKAGLPAMGVRGAALATIISQCISCVWVVAFLFGKKTILRLKAKNFFVSPKIILPCITLGLATFIMQSSESVISVCFNSSLLKYGGDIAVGAMTILTSVMQFAMLPLNGISQGSQPILSYNYGAGNSERVKKTFKLLLAVCLTYSFLLWGFIELFPQGFARMFSSDAALIGFTAHALRIYCAVLCLFGIQMSCQMAFVSIGSALCSISVAVVRKFVLLLPLIYIMPAFVADKTMGVYMAEPVADVIAITFTSILFTIQFGKAMKKLEAQKKGEAK